MGRPKSDVDSSYISFRYSDNSKNELDKFSEERNTTRTETIVKAISHYIHSKQCLICGAVNPGDGVHCAVCGADLFSYDDVKKAAVMIAENEFEDFISGDIKLLRISPALEEAGFEKEYAVCYYPCTNGKPGKYGLNTVEIILCLSLKLKKTNDTITGIDGEPLKYHINSNLLYAVLISDIEEINRINKEITADKLKHPFESKSLLRRIPHDE